MKKSFIRKMALAACSVMLLASLPAYANTDPKGEADMEPAVIIEVEATPIPTAIPEPEVTTPPFSVPGNGEVMDDLPDGNKEFYTITTVNGNTFYLVVDKASSTQNVYMLSKVDEADVAEFIDNRVTPSPAPTASIIIQQPTNPPIQTEPVPQQKEDKTSEWMVIGGSVLAAVLALYYFKIYKPRKEEELDDDEGMEYDDSDEDEE